MSSTAKAQRPILRYARAAYRAPFIFGMIFVVYTAASLLFLLTLPIHPSQAGVVFSEAVRWISFSFDRQ